MHSPNEYNCIRVCHVEVTATFLGGIEFMLGQTCCPSNLNFVHNRDTKDHIMKGMYSPDSALKCQGPLLNIHFPEELVLGLTP